MFEALRGARSRPAPQNQDPSGSHQPDPGGRGHPPSTRWRRSARRVTRIARSPADWLERRALARGTPPAPVPIDERLGYALFGPGELPGCEGAIDAARRVWTETRAHIERITRHHPGRFGIVFDLLSDDRIVQHPALLDFALSDPVLDAVTGYLGTVPVLRRIGLGYSPVGPPGRAPFASQLFHLDREDDRQAKLFLAPEIVASDMGPFSFAPAPASARVLRCLPASRASAALEVPDAAVHAELGGPPARLTGPPGSGVFVDTSRCLHFGSRDVRRPRRLLTFVYQRHHLVDETPFNCFDLRRAGSDRRRQLALTPPRPCPPGYFFPNPLTHPGPSARGRAKGG